MGLDLPADDQGSLECGLNLGNSKGSGIAGIIDDPKKGKKRSNWKNFLNF